MKTEICFKAVSYSLVIAIIGFAAAVLWVGILRSSERLNQEQVIAHAMGGIDGFTYTNSRDAFIWNYQRGFRIFEVDLLFTKTGDIVAFHSLDSVVKEFGIHRHIRDYTIEEFLRERIRGRYVPLDINGIVELAQAHPNAKFVLDLKDSNDNSNTEDLIHDPDAFDKLLFGVVAAITAKDRAVLSRLVPQIYSEGDLDTIRKLHDFDQVIYTLYRTQSTDAQIIDFADRSPEIKFVAFERRRFSPSLVRNLARRHVKALVYTVNDPAEVSYFLAAGAYGVYTDYYAPDISD